MEKLTLLLFPFNRYNANLQIMQTERLPISPELKVH